MPRRRARNSSSMVRAAKLRPPARLPRTWTALTHPAPLLPRATAVAILDFDITVGDGIQQRYPSSAQLPFSDDKLSALCMPEGGHIHPEDHTFLFCKEPVTNDQARRARAQPAPPPSPTRASPAGSSSASLTFGTRRMRA